MGKCEGESRGCVRGSGGLMCEGERGGCVRREEDV